MQRAMTTAAGAIVMAAFANPAVAQTATGNVTNPQAQADNGGLGDIVVTARRREESLQAVPVAVTALTGDNLREANVTRIENLGNIAPSLIIAPTNGRANVPGFALRGQRQDAAFLTNDPSVGIYFAEAVQVRVFGFGQSLFDLESVQVLKGPQGTLFGRNTTGGAILIQPNRPRLNEFSGYMQASYGNFDRFDVQGAINIPVNEMLAVRLAYNRTRRDGFVTNVTTGQHLNSEHTDTVRGIILFRPSDRFSNTLYIDHFNSDSSGSAQRLTAVNPTGQAQIRFGLRAILDRQNATLGFYDVEGNVPGASAGSNLGVTNVTVGEMSDRLTLKNIASYRRIRSTEIQDLDGTNAPVLATNDVQHVTQLVDELQLQGKALDDRLNFILGGFYFVEDGFRSTRTPSLGGLPAPRRGDATNESYSVFVQGDYKLTDQLTLTLGGRYNWDIRQFQQRVLSATTGACTFCTGNLSKRFEAPTYTASLSWQIDADRLLYVAHRRGYRAGGFNSGGINAASLLPFGPETVTDYEIGFKGDWRLGGGHLRTNLAIYQADYKDIQRTVILAINNVPINSIFNAASARIRGAEAEVRYIPVRGLELSGSMSYTDTKYTDFQYHDVAGNLIDQSANRFSYIPRWTYRLAARYHVPVGNHTEFSANLDYYWQSSVFYSDFNAPRNAQGSYGLLSGRVELSNVAGTGVTVGLWGRNLTDRHYFAAASDQFTGLGHVYKAYGEPRTYGADVMFRF
jgi:iron complex outermembrane receptor protein